MTGASGMAVAPAAGAAGWIETAGAAGSSGAGGGSGTIAEGGIGGEGPTADNLVANAGFDTSIDGWLDPDRDSVSEWITLDASDNPSSGSLQVSNVDGRNDGPAYCVELAADTAYSTAVRAFVPADQEEGVSASLELFMYTDQDCSEPRDSLGSVASSATSLASWSPLSLSFVTPPDTRSVAIRLLVRRDFRSQPGIAYFDDVTLARSP